MGDCGQVPQEVHEGLGSAGERHAREDGHGALADRGAREDHAVLTPVGEAFLTPAGRGLHRQ
ncbi:hypothetical protein ACIP8U_27305 [Streptomyces pseudovenezuelae]|uniref:hypothetical protein n=1 Tax=Streptomyces pseudovenezuelae TaxID=67350 RepID=UPI00382C87F5